MTCEHLAKCGTAYEHATAYEHDTVDSDLAVMSKDTVTCQSPIESQVTWWVRTPLPEAGLRGLRHLHTQIRESLLLIGHYTSTCSHCNSAIEVPNYH